MAALNRPSMIKVIRLFIQAPLQRSSAGISNRLSPHRRPAAALSSESDANAQLNLISNKFSARHPFQAGTVEPTISILLHRRRLHRPVSAVILHRRLLLIRLVARFAARHRSAEQTQHKESDDAFHKLLLTPSGTNPMPDERLVVQNKIPLVAAIPTEQSRQSAALRH